MTRPLVKPIRPEFSSGPCAKRPGWSFRILENSCLGRSHRHPLAKSKLYKVIELTKNILEIPEDYFVGIVPGSDTGAIEMAMWNFLGPMPVTMLAWDSFGLDWSQDIKSQLKLTDVTSSFPQSSSIANAADVASQIVIPFRFGSSQFKLGTQTPVVVPFQVKPTSRSDL